MKTEQITLLNVPNVVTLNLKWDWLMNVGRQPSAISTLRLLVSLPEVLNLSKFYKSPYQTTYKFMGMTIFTGAHYMSI